MSSLTQIKPNALRGIIDALVAGGLVAVLGAVLWFDRSTAPSAPPPLGRLQVREVAVSAGASLAGQEKLRLAVTPPELDDMGKLLRSLGKGYAYEELPLESLLEASLLKRYNVIFFTCGGVPDSWVAERLRDSARPGFADVRPKLKVVEKVCRNLRDFVSEGGTLYASDLQFPFVANAFKELVSPGEAVKGDAQVVSAQVTSPGLKRLLGDTIDLQFDKPDWCSAAFRGEDCETLLRGSFRAMNGKTRETPLLVRFSHGRGMVVFTSFHNEKINSEIAERLLRFLVFTAVTASTESFATKRLAEDGFRPADRGLLSAPNSGRTVQYTYECEKQATTLRFALAFLNAGARLRLTITDPNGLEFQKEATATCIVDVPNASRGRWTCSVQAVELPYPNFPFTVSVGEKQ